MPTTSMYCGYCRRQVKAEADSYLVAHILMTILTAGLWLPVWVVSMFAPAPWRCSRCGRKLVGLVAQLVGLVATLATIGVVGYGTMLVLASRG